MTITCFIRYEIDPFGKADFWEYARNWGQAIPRCGADLIGYFAPHEGSATTAYGVYNIENLAAYEAYRARLAADPLGRENYEFARAKKFIHKEDRIFLKLASGPHAASFDPEKLQTFRPEIMRAEKVQR
jgi:hypothetical protein